MKKNDIAVIVLLFGLLIAWPVIYQKYVAPEPVPQDVELLQEPAVPAADTNTASGSSQPAALTEAVEEQGVREVMVEPVEPAATDKPELSEEQLLRVGSESIDVTVSTHGGGIKVVQLNQYPEEQRPDSPPYEMLFDGDASLTLYRADGRQVVDFEPVRVSESNVVLTGLYAEGITVQRSLYIGKHYLVHIADTFLNQRGVPVEISSYPLNLGVMSQEVEIKTPYAPAVLGIDTLAPDSGSVVHWGKKLPKLFKEVSGDQLMKKEEQAVDWLAVKNKFFTQILTPEGGGKAFRLIATRGDNNKDITSVAGDVYLDEFLLAPDGSYAREMDYYAGPKKLNILKDQGYHQSDVMELGWTSPIGRFLLVVLNLIHDYLPPHNYGIAIILLTIIIRVIFWPITHKGTESMRRMQEVSPLIKELNEKYKDQPERKQKAMMELYKEHKINPVGGCLPMLIQIPVFISLFFVLRSAIELRFADFLWIKDLSEPERIFEFGFAIPLLAWDAFNLLPFLMAGSMVWQQKVTPTSSAGNSQQEQMQKMMMTFMPVMMLFFLYNMPAGLALYWTTQNLLMVAQQLIYKKRKQLKEATA